MKASLDYKEELNYSVLKIEGRIDASNSNKVEGNIYELVRANKLVCDLSTLDFIDSSGLVVLITLHSWVKDQGGEMVVSGLNEKVRMVFEITRASEIVKVFNDTTNAISQIGVAA